MLVGEQVVLNQIGIVTLPSRGGMALLRNGVWTNMSRGADMAFAQFAKLWVPRQCFGLRFATSAVTSIGNPS